MSTATKTGTRAKPKFKQTEGPGNKYSVATESMTVEDKLKILDDLGRPELKELFKGWKPRQARHRRKGAPLDQRVAITVTDREKFSLDKEMQEIKAAGEKITTSQFIRNRALGTLDIAEWDTTARAALERLETINENQNDLRKRKRVLAILLEEVTDSEDEAMYEIEVTKINRDLDSIVAQSSSRKNRLSGRMSMAEAETVRWRAQRLCLSSSDYLRMVIFNLAPDTNADAHMSLDARKRFYVSIMDVASNGWGNPPNIYECSQCTNYVDEISRLQDRVRQLETFV